jgi:hypothetical protein
MRPAWLLHGCSDKHVFGWKNAGQTLAGWSWNDLMRNFVTTSPRTRQGKECLWRVKEAAGDAQISRASAAKTVPWKKHRWPTQGKSKQIGK